MWHIISLRGIKCKSDTADIVSYYNITNISVIVYINNEVINEIISNENKNDFVNNINNIKGVIKIK